MARLGPILAGVGLVLACATTPRPTPPISETPILPPEPVPSPVAPPAFEAPWLVPEQPDLDHWPSGWIDDAQGPRLGLAPSFWTPQRLAWREALDPQTRPSRAVQRLQTIVRNPLDRDEELRAAWRLRLIYATAGLGADSRTWLDRASELAPQSGWLRLERLWDQAFRLGDLWGARGLWPAEGWSGLDEADQAKARLLRAKLFLGADPVPAGVGPAAVSALALDRDDLWTATWTGAVWRTSLVSGEQTVLLTPSQVAPVVKLAVTGWFVYAFQDQALMRYSKVTGVWRSFPYPAGWTGLRITGAVPTGQETVVIGYLGQGLWRFDAGQWSALDTEGPGPFVTALAADGTGGWAVGTKDRGLWWGGEGHWQPAPGGPVNVSALALGEAGTWAVGSWGEGRWLWSPGGWVRLSGDDFVPDVVWTGGAPLWAVLDRGLVWGDRELRAELGPRDGLPGGGVTVVEAWQDRWIWGTMGQGVAWWGEHEDSTVHR